MNRSVWESDPEQQVDELFALAKQKNADIDMHLDNSDNAVAFTLPYVCKKTIEDGYQGRVTVAHIPSQRCARSGGPPRHRPGQRPASTSVFYPAGFASPGSGS